MAKGYQKGARRPDPRANRDRGRRETGYQLQGGIPWPTLGDGTPYTEAIERVTLKDQPDVGGRLQWRQWRDPEGEWLKEPLDKQGRAKPGAWWAVVSWDNADEGEHPDSMVRLADLIPEPR